MVITFPGIIGKKKNPSVAYNVAMTITTMYTNPDDDNEDPYYIVNRYQL
jgi:hypothetical protein